MRRSLDEWEMGQRYVDAQDRAHDETHCSECGEYIDERPARLYLDDKGRCSWCHEDEPETCGWCGEPVPCGHADCAEWDAEMAEVGR